MSYQFSMTFWEVKNKADVFDKARQFMEELVQPASVKEMLDRNLRYFRRLVTEGKDGDMQVAVAKYLDDWLAATFSAQFTYWPQHNLLAVRGDHWPKKCMAQAAGSVYFQNSTDQNYEFDWWPSKIPFFQERIKEFQSLADGEAKKKWCKAIDISEEKTTADAEYARCSLMYRRVYDDLNLENWIYRKDEGFQRFAMSGIVSSDVAFDLSTRARARLLKLA